jgi:hypothetical protein
VRVCVCVCSTSSPACHTHTNTHTHTQAVVLDVSEAAMSTMRARNANKRAGLISVVGDPSSDPFPELPDSCPTAFDLVVDKVWTVWTTP